MMNIPSLGELFISKSNHEQHRQVIGFFSSLLFLGGKYKTFCLHRQCGNLPHLICAHSHKHGQERTAARHRWGIWFGFPKALTQGLWQTSVLRWGIMNQSFWRTQSFEGEVGKWVQHFILWRCGNENQTITNKRCIAGLGCLVLQQDDRKSSRNLLRRGRVWPLTQCLLELMCYWHEQCSP